MSTDGVLCAWWAHRQGLDGSLAGASAAEVFARTGWGRSLGGAAARNLGPEGVKKGVSTTLPMALGLMQSAGEIRRAPVNGRLDQQKCRYAPWRPNPLAKWKKTPDETFVELAHRYFEWLGPATARDFQEFAGIGVKAAKAAMEPLKLIDSGGERFLLPEHEAAFRKFKVAARPQYALVSNIDNMPVIDEERRKPFAESNRIFDRGQLVGRWEFDTATQSTAWVSFTGRDSALEDAVRKTEAFIREDLSDARGFSLDSPKSRGPGIEAIRIEAILKAGA